MNVVKKMLQNLMPYGFAWQGKTDGYMSQLLAGLSEEFTRLRDKAYRLGSALFPQTTQYIPEWEFEFALPDAPELNETDRRNRLDGRWAMVTQGSMQSDNMEFIFALSGIDLVARPLAPGENPFGYFILDGQAFYGNLLSMYGRVQYGDGFPIAEPDNQLLINGGSFNYFEDPAQAGGLIPSDSDFWPMIYILEDEFGNPLDLPLSYRSMLYDIIYATKPAHMWCILRVNFTSAYIFAPPGLTETRRFYWDYDGGSDTSIIYMIMDANDSDWGEPESSYSTITGAKATYKKQTVFGDDPDANTFDGNFQGAGPGDIIKDIEILSLGGTNYEKVNQGDYIEHKFYLINNGTPTATLSIDGVIYPSNDLSGVLIDIEFDDTEKVVFDTVNPSGVIITA
jgi:hypothetical protein